MLYSSSREHRRQAFLRLSHFSDRAEDSATESAPSLQSAHTTTPAIGAGRETPVLVPESDERWARDKDQKLATRMGRPVEGSLGRARAVCPLSSTHTHHTGRWSSSPDSNPLPVAAWIAGHHWTQLGLHAECAHVGPQSHGRLVFQGCECAF